MRYEVSTPVFEGPFDLLLHLILSEQVELYEVSLASITDAYLAHVEAMEDLDLEIATEFLLIAATLVELKTRRLLPSVVEDGDLDEELALWSERDQLLARLLEAKTFKDAAGRLRGLAEAAGRSFPRTAGLEEVFVGLAPDLLATTGPDDLARAAARALTPRPAPRVMTDHVAPVRASVTDAVAEVVDELPAAGRMSFWELTAGLEERLEVVVRFLALLELFKQGVIDLDQPETFGDITAVWLGHDAGEPSPAGTAMGDRALVAELDDEGEEPDDTVDFGGDRIDPGDGELDLADADGDPDEWTVGGIVAAVDTYEG